MRRGNSVRPGTGPRRSNVAGFPVYPETLRPGQPVDAVPSVDQNTDPPPAVILNGSALPKAAAVVVETPSANDDAAPDSSTRSKDGPAVAKTDVTTPSADPSSAPATEKEEAKAKEDKDDKEAKESVKTEPERAGGKMRTDRPDRPERRARERKGGRGRSAAPPPVAPAAAEPEATSASATSAPTTEKAVVAHTVPSPVVARGIDAPVEPTEKGTTPHADLDEKFFAEGVHSEQEMLAAAAAADGKSSRPSAPLEEEIDPKILLKLQPDVRARRAKFGSVAKWVSIVCVVLIGAAALARYKNGQDSQEAAEREMAAYAAAHTYTAPTDKPPPAAAPTQTTTAAAVAPADSAEVPAPADSVAAANPAGSNAPPGRAPLGPEAVASAAPAAPAASGAAAGTALSDTETPPAKTAQQEKRDAQILLDRGAFGRAAEAGERSVRLDPSDGEAWLLLGASYQSMGRAGDAKRAFNSCLSQGKKGPLGECKAMLQ
jgi:tetratricopeptide (TPR) repeat protein